jgi:hypothetical protein
LSTDLKADETKTLDLIKGYENADGNQGGKMLRGKVHMKSNRDKGGRGVIYARLSYGMVDSVIEFRFGKLRLKLPYDVPAFTTQGILLSFADFISFFRGQF